MLQKVHENSITSSYTGLTSALHGIPYNLEDSSCILDFPCSYRYPSAKVFSRGLIRYCFHVTTEEEKKKSKHDRSGDLAGQLSEP
ncbi:hypothetical protein AVEN_143381-1 [Araneus ventricosus]|uniref:Uncharacterized protein n=1 Tax=Araneus ventricosus TaxID=182803 RepID=A0A4Y2AGJ7_ARAVE|nr:hypothetical protein AVEN_143381-1 [Araneus ventricosus]